MLCSFNVVNIVPMRLSKSHECSTIKCCNRPVEYCLFYDDGKTSSSRLVGCSCKKHIHIAIKKAWAENRKDKGKWEERQKSKEVEELKKLASKYPDVIQKNK